MTNCCFGLTVMFIQTNTIYHIFTRNFHITAVDVIGLSLQSPNHISTAYCPGGYRLCWNKHSSQHKDNTPWLGFEPGTGAVPFCSLFLLEMRLSRELSFFKQHPITCAI